MRDAMFASADLCAVTCGACGQSAPLERFVSAPVYGALPAATFQCPACREAFVRKLVADRWGDMRVVLQPTGSVL